MDDVIPLKQFGISEVLKNPFQRINKYGAYDSWMMRKYLIVTRLKQRQTIFPLMSNEKCKNTVCLNLKLMRILTKKKIQKNIHKNTKLEIIFSDATNM